MYSEANRFARWAAPRLARKTTQTVAAVAAQPAMLAHYARCVPPWLKARRMLAGRTLSETDLRSLRKSDTVFVFGSGASLNDISAAEWRHIEGHDTFGFNWFVHQRFVRCDFHLIRQIADSNERSVWEPQTREYFRLLEAQQFRDTVLIVQHELRARGLNLAFELGVFPLARRVFTYRTSGSRQLSKSFAGGLSHGSSTLLDTVNAAFLAGWTSIVLVGIDLYDRRYFWLPEGETRPVDRARGATAAEAHSQASAGLTETLSAWAAELERSGVRMSVYNPRSLLAEKLPMYHPAA